MNTLSDSSAAATERHDDSNPQEQSALRNLYQRAMKLIQAECDPRAWEIIYRVVIEHESAVTLVKELSISPVSIRMANSRSIRRIREVVGEPLDDDSSLRAP